MVTQHDEPECHAEKLVCSFQCQGHSEGLHNQNMTISTLSSKLGFVVQHHKLECPVEQLNYCVQNEGQKCL